MWQIIIIHYSECDKLFSVLNSPRIMIYERPGDFASLSLKSRNIFYDARRRSFRSHDFFLSFSFMILSIKEMT